MEEYCKESLSSERVTTNDCEKIHHSHCFYKGCGRKKECGDDGILCPYHCVSSYHFHCILLNCDKQKHEGSSGSYCEEDCTALNHLHCSIYGCDKKNTLCEKMCETHCKYFH